MILAIQIVIVLAWGAVMVKLRDDLRDEMREGRRGPAIVIGVAMVIVTLLASLGAFWHVWIWWL